MPFYDLTTDFSTAKYNADWDAIIAAGMPTTGGLVSPLDPGVLTHIGLSDQVVQIPDGYTDAQIGTYLPPVIATGLVSRIVVWDEPDPSILSEVEARIAFVRPLAPGVTLTITNFSVAGITPYVGVADEIWVDNYPARTNDWAFTELQACVAACGASPYGIVLDAFTAPSYPLPTPAQLQSEINYALTTAAVILPVYAWPLDPSLEPVLKTPPTPPAPGVLKANYLAMPASGVDLAGQTVTFTDASRPGPSGPITSWDFDFGDGSPHASGPGPWTHVYPMSGTYMVTLVVDGTSPDGSATARKPYVVEPVGPGGPGAKLYIETEMSA